MTDLENRRIALVLAGGLGLGAVQAGVCEALQSVGASPDWLVGTSIGAVNAAVVAGNAPDRTLDALRAFWSEAALPSGWPGPGAAADDWTRLSAQAGILFGHPALFSPNLMGAFGSPPRVGMYDLAPLARALERHVDFGRLNGGERRVTVTATELITGARLLFDTAREAIEPEHILASSALLPDFAPVQIGERLLADGGFTGNLPLDVVAAEPDSSRLIVAVDLFSLHGAAPKDMAAALVRRHELVFANQSRLMIQSCLPRLLPSETKRRLRLISYSARCDIGNSLYDFSAGALEGRWRAGADLGRSAVSDTDGAQFTAWRWDGERAVQVAAEP
jgi:NTE family protein